MIKKLVFDWKTFINIYKKNFIVTDYMNILIICSVHVYLFIFLEFELEIILSLEIHSSTWVC